jgi:vacuolar protein sorting-associated protein 54
MSLKSVVNSHVQGYVTAHGDMESQALAQGMSSDTWQDKDFTAEDNEILRQILQCSTADLPEWTELSKIWAFLSQEEVELTCVEANTVNAQVRGAIIDEETSLLPSSAILCLKGTSHFLRLIGGIPSMTLDITMSVISYLQTFDSRCRQLVLGAGAMLSVGLGSITTTHLVVAL